MLHLEIGNPLVFLIYSARIEHHLLLIVIDIHEMKIDYPPIFIDYNSSKTNEPSMEAKFLEWAVARG